MSLVIDDLLDEVLVLILGRIDLLERLRLRPVCWRWKRIIENLRIKNVNIVDSWFNPRKSSWLDLGIESLNCQNLIYYSNPSFYRRLTSLFGAIGETAELSGSLRFVSKPMSKPKSKPKSMFISFKSINNFFFEKYSTRTSASSSSCPASV